MQKNRYNIPSHPDKIVFSQSWLSQYFTCPLRFKLAGEHTVSWDSNATRMGNVFERLVLGDFDGKLEEYSWGKTAKTQEMIQKCADDFLKKCKHKPEAGTIQEKIIVDLGKFGLGGALDHMGRLLDDVEYINDLKFSSSPLNSTFYNPFSAEKGIQDILQPLTYTFLIYKKYGKILPFRRIVVSPLGDETNIWTKEFVCDLSTFRWFETQLNVIYNNYITGFLPPAQEETEACYSRKQGACKYLAFCQVGKDRIFTKEKVSVNEVLGIEELAY